MSCLKYLLVFLNVLYMLIATFMIIVGTCGLSDFSIHYLMNAFSSVAILCLATGIYMGFISMFALIASLKEKDKWLNAYGFFMIITFLMQIIIVIAIFHRTGSSKHYASVLFTRLMTSNGYVGNERRTSATLDWIQTTFNCCGLNGPSDWDKVDDPYSDYWLRSTPSPQLITQAVNFKTPSSCCTTGSNYQNSTCEYYFTDGCVEQVTELVWSSIMILGTAALTISVIQIFGIITAFMLARAIQRNKSTQSESSTYIGYTPLIN